tara:strand:- start:973 stop:2229 length:1257 start_codon:yes stop_codon:yes gene_type:complete
LIVENNIEKEQFLEYWNNEQSIVIPIWEDLERHPMTCDVSFLYVRFQNLDFVLPFNHNDCEPIEIDLSKSTQPKWVWNKKALLQTDLKIQNQKDIQTSLFFNENKLYPFGEKLEVLTNFYHRLGMRDGLGKSIPIMKFMEVLGDMSNDFGKLSPTFDWIDNTMIPILSDVERKGIQVDRKKFFDRWKDNKKSLWFSRTFTEYNPYTITSRPSNRHLGINFSALSKKDKSREIFIPQEGKKFVQFDYDAYHVRIIAKLIKYDLPDTSVHSWLANQYNCGYDESKGRTFRILYGGVSDEDRKIPFFDKVDKFIHKMQEESIDRGFIKTPMGRKIPIGWIEQPTAQKYFNYLLQASETEFNIEVMKKLKDSGLPLPNLYTYDSFLFEFGIEDTEVLRKIKPVLESFGFPTKVSYGDDYSLV